MVAFSKIAVLAGTAAAQRDLFQVPVNNAFLSHTRPVQPAQYAYGQASADVVMVAQPMDQGIPVYAMPTGEYEESQGWGWTAVLSAVAVGAVAGKAIGGRLSTQEGSDTAPRYEMAALAIAGKQVQTPSIKPRSDPVMQEAAAVDPDDAKFCYGMAGSIAPFPNFDPLGLVEGVKRGFVDPKEEMMRRRESELVHGRVSMLAALGFMTQESFHPLFGGDISGPAINQIPQLPSEYWATLLFGIVLAEKFRIDRGWADPRDDDGNTQRLKPDYMPGDLGFDPMGLKPKTEKEFRVMQEKELSHGRLAMLAAAGFMAQETVTQQPWLATLAVTGTEASNEENSRSDPVMQEAAAVDPDDAKFCYGMTGSIAPFPNFDPLGLVEGVKRGFVDPKEEMMRRRESELAHGRVGMLASLGFMTQESFHPLFGGDISGPAINQIPQLPSEYWATLLFGIVLAEKYRIDRGWADPRDDDGNTQRLKPDYMPGDLGFDPMGLKPKTEKEFRVMQEKELSHGRLAMLAAAGFMAQETVTQQPWLATLAVTGKEVSDDDEPDPVVQA